MAGIKITQLTTLGEAASDDLLYIVDVSDNTQSPEGTSKQIELGNILPIESGTWTPTITTEYSASILLKAIYSRVNNCVNFQIEFGLLNGAARLSGDTFFSPPNGLIPSSNISGLMAFTIDSNSRNAVIESYAFGTNGTDIAHNMINSSSLANYRIFIQGSYLIA